VAKLIVFSYTKTVAVVGGRALKKLSYFKRYNFFFSNRVDPFLISFVGEYQTAEYDHPQNVKFIEDQ
jgi:hypothetical protein